MAETQIQDRGQYSPNGAYPQELPDYWKFSDGTIRTDLPELSDNELKELGWYGPIQMPPIAGTSYFTHNYEWNSETLSFNAIEIDEYEKKRRVDYQRFWNMLIDSSAYLKIKETSSQSLLVNTIATEFIALMSDAKNNNANIEKIQESITNIFTNITFTEDELAELQQIFVKTGMSVIYTIAV
jgi:hypothetical protein